MADLKKENSKKAARRRFEARELVYKIKSGPCESCSMHFEPCQMDFVRRTDAKSQSVSRLLHYSQETILREIESCFLLCANCARLVIWHRQRAKRSGPT